jgi:hypothetical protein
MMKPPGSLRFATALYVLYADILHQANPRNFIAPSMSSFIEGRAKLAKTMCLSFRPEGEIFLGFLVITPNDGRRPVALASFASLKRCAGYASRVIQSFPISFSPEKFEYPWLELKQTEKISQVSPTQD